MEMSREEKATRRVEVLAFAILTHLAGNPERAKELQTIAKEQLYPKKDINEVPTLKLS
jgi:hypothetical protein